MKKILIPLLSVMGVLLFTATTFALHASPEGYEYEPQIVKSGKAMWKLSGSIRIRGEYADNNSDFRDTDNGSYLDRKAAYDQRIRLKVDATVSPNTKGVVELESNTDTHDTYTWGKCSTGAKGVYREGNCKPTDLYIRQAYIAHQGNGLLGRLAGFKAGHMLLKLGNGLFFNHAKFGDDAIVLWVSGSEISFTAIKLNENDNAFSDDADAYVLSAEQSLNGIDVSADVTYVNDNNFNAGASNGLDFWNIGLRGSTEVQGVSVKADVEFQTGKAKKYKADGDDLKFGGYAFLIGADAKLGDVTVGVEGAYGSGDDIDTENKYEGFVTSLSSGQHYTYLYDQKAKGAGQAPSTSTTTSSTFANTTNYGLNNTWYLNVGASTKVNPDVKVMCDLYYLRASKKVSDARNLDSKDIGVEIDGKLTYQIDKNLIYFVEAGYLWADDLYKNLSTVGANEDPDNPYAVRHGIVLKF